ncbi:pyridine nucleotide-disulfide oxidoreductase-domain-containing protein [Kickxella alabastrina]|uniref:pyridine nucleotide-disulfide oxidoreductase-domain-containing protein n=1 Tax=Kickxella alabastrina TaxID=61397 RepID=UPI0022204861|nr:pyridine nucleotide-disulfide oxidoreductase-domain-containing protein [Kickxella alabastrina]KAI7835036.1 pyridine nucleotide-disulfide oxidoreductase-domain-containing protein [Kickxella alabastrina]KAJ1947665.1 NADH:ubiquinone oxidoreductase [Kickxella alabastrina]
MFSASKASFRLSRAAISTAAQRMAMSTLNETAKQQPRTPRLRILKRIIYGTALGTISYTGWLMYRNRNPVEQQPFDPSKKTMVLLGTGWGSTTILKNLDTENFNVVVVSPRNYFLFTPLLPSCTVGTIENRSIMEPVRLLMRHKNREVKFYEAECTDIDAEKKELVLERRKNSESQTEKITINYDYLVVGVGGTVNTFGTPGVEENACFLKEMGDARKIRRRLIDCVEQASFDHISEAERDRLLHMVVVGGGPTGIEYAGELHDFLEDDLAQWYPGLADRVRITLVEALPNVLPAFDKKLIDYTQSTFSDNKITILTRTMVKEVKDKSFIVQNPDGTRSEIPYGLLVWATGIKSQPVVNKIREQFSAAQTNGRGLLVDEYMRVKGAKDVWALGDCALSGYAPLAQVAAQQGKWLSRNLNKLSKKHAEDPDADMFALIEKSRPFKYSSQGSLAYIGSEKAIADLPFFNRNITAGGIATFWFWKSAYLSELFSLRNSTLVASDWVKRYFFGRDISRE